MVMNWRWAAPGLTARHSDYLLALDGCLVVWLPDEVLSLLSGFWSWWQSTSRHEQEQQRVTQAARPQCARVAHTTAKCESAAPSCQMEPLSLFLFHGKTDAPWQDWCAMTRLRHHDQRMPPRQDKRTGQDALKQKESWPVFQSFRPKPPFSPSQS